VLKEEYGSLSNRNKSAKIQCVLLFRLIKVIHVFLALKINIWTESIRLQLMLVNYFDNPSSNHHLLRVNSTEICWFQRKLGLILCIEYGYTSTANYPIKFKEICLQYNNVFSHSLKKVECILDLFARFISC
jgi:hypothetical protein